MAIANGQPPALPLYNLHQRHRGLTPALAAAYVEAASVCLDRHHKPPVEFGLTDKASTQVKVSWRPTNESVRAAHANQDDATRDGAYACALAAVELKQRLVGVRRANTKSGADYYVAPIDSDGGDMEDWIRFEVSGTDRGGGPAIRTRLAEKLEQLRRGDPAVGGIACVVGFKARRIELGRLERP